jgi:hypothetical protein
MTFVVIIMLIRMVLFVRVDELQHPLLLEYGFWSRGIAIYRSCIIFLLMTALTPSTNRVSGASFFHFQIDPQ